MNPRGVDTGKLSPQRAKRDVRQTGELGGDNAQVRRAPYLRFVVQKHAASHLHYDLRLELEIVFNPGPCRKARRSIVP